MDLELIGNLLGISTLAVSFVGQVPQILTLLKTKKVEGVSFDAYFIEICSLTIQVLYFFVKEYSVLSYADISVLLLQDYILVFLLLMYDNKTTSFKQYAQIIGYVGALTAVITGTVTKELVVTVMQGVTFLNIFSKVTFLASILSSKDTSNMAASSFGLYVYANIVRMFTGYVILKDTTVFMQMAVNCTFNAIITYLIIRYKDGNKNKEKKSK